MKALPDACGLPVAKPPPTGRPAPAPEFVREESPRAARSEDEDDPAERRTIRDTWATALRLRRLLQEQRLDGFPEVVGNKQGIHDTEASR